MTILPKPFLSSLEGLPGFDRAAFEAVHADGVQVTSIRLNPGKRGEGGGAAGAVGGAGVEEGGGAGAVGGAGVEQVPWSSFGYYLPRRPSFTLDPLFHAGAYYVQEASSMFLEHALRQTIDLSRPLRVLDLCAAPGGKSTLLQSLLPAGSLLVSNEVIRHRVNVLEENMIKWGGANVVVTSNDPQELGRLENYFDVILVDAPCSGSGLFRREAEAVRAWSPDNVRLCSQRQQRILADSWPALRQDGLLIYSTCSYSREENEDILDWMTEDLGVTGCRLTMGADWGVVETAGRLGADRGIVETAGRLGAYGYRFYPDKLRGEGLFMACLRKTGGAAFAAARKKGSIERVPKKDLEKMSGWVRSDRGLAALAYFYHRELIHAIPEVLLAELSVLQSACYLRRAGVPIGKLSVKEFIPEHDLAMSTLIHPELPAMSLSREQALSYLRKDELVKESDHRGWMSVQYARLNLGWIKVLPGRINNYYPKEWRILRREP
jgi:16S rRNA C967 or C1407 C5-methylase (RsmB/RsmF family)/NOL1/NOP2/fmu family ribosome biogenesis protein